MKRSETVSRLKEYLERLNAGEELEAVRADFREQFAHTDPADILTAEQEMLASGTPLSQVQKLCDVHAALFQETALDQTFHDNRKALAEERMNIPGHPLNRFVQENQVLMDLIGQIRTRIEKGEDFSEEFTRFRGVATHYAMKGDLIYPLLKVEYGISGPADVMWSNDDEIRDELSILTRLGVGERGYAAEHLTDWDGVKQRLLAVLTRAEEMIRKENSILFAVCARHFTQEDWVSIYYDCDGYENALLEEVPCWEEAERMKDDRQEKPSETGGEDRIPFRLGSLTSRQLTAVLNSVPLEITFIDENNINTYYNDGWKLFKRPARSLGREVFSCHPPKVEPMVRRILEDLRSGRKDRVPIWMMKGGRNVLVTYMAVREPDGTYLGTMELIQDMEEAKMHFERTGGVGTPKPDTSGTEKEHGW